MTKDEAVKRFNQLIFKYPNQDQAASAIQRISRADISRTTIGRMSKGQCKLNTLLLVIYVLEQDVDERQNQLI